MAKLSECARIKIGLVRRMVSLIDLDFVDELNKKYKSRRLKRLPKICFRILNEDLPVDIFRKIAKEIGYTLVFNSKPCLLDRVYDDKTKPVRPRIKDGEMRKKWLSIARVIFANENLLMEEEFEWRSEEEWKEIMKSIK